MTDRAFSAEYDAMQRALQLAATDGVPLHPNPRVGCVLLDAAGVVVGEGYHRGAGSPHAEIEALQVAGDRARGGTAVLTLEPCHHTGRTGPCSEALIAAGVERVVVAQRDPNPLAQGGIEALTKVGVTVEVGLLEEDARALNPAWTFAHEHGRPFVTWKFATTLDGRSAAADGSSRWVSSPPARRDSHVLRALCDTVLVGSNTVAVDDPSLTVRGEDDRVAPHQPLRAVMGLRDLARRKAVFDDHAETVQLRTRDPREALATLYEEHDRHHVFFEGGPTLAAAFLAAGVIDEIVVYIAPTLLGAGAPAVGDLGIETIADARQLRITDITVLGDGTETNLRLTLAPSTADSKGA